MQELLTCRRVALFGGVYSNYLALAAALAEARRRGAEAMYCLGDLGGLGPHPDRVFPLLQQAGVACIQGNYDVSVAQGAADCGCGYTDPRDNFFARISYEYTVRRTSSAIDAASVRSQPRRSSSSADRGCCSPTARRAVSTSSAGRRRRRTA